MHPVSIRRPRGFDALCVSLSLSFFLFSLFLSALLFQAAANSSREPLNLPVSVMLGAFLEAPNVQKAPADKSGGFQLSRVYGCTCLCVGVEWLPFQVVVLPDIDFRTSELVKQSERLSQVLHLCPQPSD